jgi:hypothetical protein
MSYVVREVVGWLIALVGLVLIGLLVVLALNRNVFEAMALSFPATIVFRSGIGLVRMAAASRVASKLTRDQPA